jgi:excisionase family DNA binding protein
MTNEKMHRAADAKVREVAEYLSLHPETFRILARSGDFPNAYKTSGRTSPIRIPWADVEAWRAKQPRVNR